MEKEKLYDYYDIFIVYDYLIKKLINLTIEFILSIILIKINYLNYY